MYAAAAEKQNKTSKTSLQQDKNEMGPTLLRKPDSADSDALSKIISSASSPGDGGASSTNPANSQTAHLSHLIQTSRIQPKHKVSLPGVRYERKADNKADAVMRAPMGNFRARPLSPRISPLIQRQDEEEEPAQTKPLVLQGEARRRPGGSLQPAETTIRREADDSEPTEEEKGAALAAAAAADITAEVAETEGENRIEKSKTEKIEKKKEGDEAEKKVVEALEAVKKSEAAAPGDEVTGEAQKAESDEDGKKKKDETSAAGKKKKDAKAPASPGEDPAFMAVIGAAEKTGAEQKTHEPAEAEAKAAQDSVESPAAELESKAQSSQVDEMERAEAPPFDAVAFKAQLMERIESETPDTIAEADDFSSDNDLGGIKNEMASKAAAEKEASQAPLKEKKDAPPDAGKVEPKPFTPLDPVDPGAEPASIGAKRAAPKSKGRCEIETPIKENTRQIDDRMTEAEVTEEQFARSNEPRFETALGAGKEAWTDAGRGPRKYRAFEKETMDKAREEAEETALGATRDMHGARAAAFALVGGRQALTKTEDEQAREKVAADIRGIYDQTRVKVEAALDKLDEDASTAFDEGASEARTAFEDYVEARMEAYRERRCGGWLGWAQWAKDKLFGMPPAVNRFYRDGRSLYLKKMDAVIDDIVAIIGAGLTEARAEVANGGKEIQTYMAGLPDNLKEVGARAAEEMQGRFADLEGSIDDKQGELIDILANKYKENLQAVDARIEEMKAGNKGLVDKAIDAVEGAIETILKLKKLLSSVLAGIAEVVAVIIDDPIGFLGNLIRGLKQGFTNFVANILKHLKGGLVAWLTGSLGPMGIRIPEDLFSLKGTFSLVARVLSLTWGFVRIKAVKLLGEPVVNVLEKNFEPFKILIAEGPAGLWEYVKEQFGNLKEMVLGQINEMVITEVIKAGVKWLLGLMSPAGALIKAAMAIHDIIMFFVDRAARIPDLINAVMDAAAAIARGAVEGAAKLVEDALAKTLPVLIGLLASLAGVSGLAKKVRKIIEKVRGKINAAINKIIMKAKKFAKKMIKSGKAGDKVELKEGSPKEKAKDPAKKDHDKQLKAGLAALEAVTERYAKDGATEEEVKAGVKAVRRKFKVFKSIVVVDGDKTWDYQYVASSGKLAGPSKNRESQSDEIRKKIRNILFEKLENGHTKEEAKKIVSSVFNKYKEKGLKKLEISPETKGGHFLILAQASKLSPIIKLLKRLRTPKSASMRSAIQITLSKAEDLNDFVELGEREVPETEKTEKIEKYVKKGPDGYQGKKVMEIRDRHYIIFPHRESEVIKTSGGYLIVPEKNKREIEMLTWNIGRTNLSKEFNKSHAEHQFCMEFDKLDKKIKKKVIKIEIVNDPLSPCDMCCYDLMILVDDLITLKKDKNDPRLSMAKISWKKAYGEDLTTSEAFNQRGPAGKTSVKGLSELREVGWTTEGPNHPILSDEMLNEWFALKEL